MVIQGLDKRAHLIGIAEEPVQKEQIGGEGRLAIPFGPEIRTSVMICRYSFRMIKIIGPPKNNVLSYQHRLRKPYP
jgi:hypothetical protein